MVLTKRVFGQAIATATRNNSDKKIYASGCVYGGIEQILPVIAADNVPVFCLSQRNQRKLIVWREPTRGTLGFV
ncbi:hypothetical protein [Achromobacter insolitus]|uniref:hypothetical protein n=1 Tax=Achromobacter insolitus TaxID=217204 RepID=UPI001748AE10|nr:hypothetical protein [Achromobacter insolitus]